MKVILAADPEAGPDKAHWQRPVEPPTQCQLSDSDLQRRATVTMTDFSFSRVVMLTRIAVSGRPDGLRALVTVTTAPPGHPAPTETNWCVSSVRPMPATLHWHLILSQNLQDCALDRPPVQTCPTFKLPPVAFARLGWRPCGVAWDAVPEQSWYSSCGAQTPFASAPGPAPITGTGMMTPRHCDIIMSVVPSLKAEFPGRLRPQDSNGRRSRH